MTDLVTHRHFLPACLVVVDCLAAGRYAVASDWWRVGYWCCAAGITVCATWGLR